jgi:hypothetical protein
MVQPGGVLNIPGIGDTLSGSIAGVLQAQQEREKLRREQEEFQSKQAYFATLNEGNKLDNETKKRKLKDEERQIQAKTVGLEAYQSLVGGTPLKQVLAKLTDPDAIDYVLTKKKELEEIQNQTALAKANTARAEVEDATKGSQITRAQAQAETATNQATVTGAQAAQAPAQEALQTQNMRLTGQKLLQDLEAKPGLDPSQVNAAVNLYRSGGVTLGEAFKTAGVPLPAGVDPNKKFEVQTRGMAIRKAEQKTAAAQALVANSALEEQLAAGRKVTVMTRLKDAVPFDAGQGMIPEDQQQILSSGGQFASQYVLSISGKAATDKEREFIMRQILPRAGDKPNHLTQKQIMREAMVQIMFDASQGADRPMADVIESIIGAAKAKGATGFQLQFLEESKRKARIMEAESKKLGPNDVPTMTAGPDPITPDSMQAMMGNWGVQ